MSMDGKIRKPSSETIGEGSAARSAKQVNSLNPFKVILKMTGSGRADVTRCTMVAAAAAQSTCLPRLLLFRFRSCHRSFDTIRGQVIDGFPYLSQTFHKIVKHNIVLYKKLCSGKAS